MAGVVAIIIVLLLLPVMVLMSGGVASALIGFFLGRDADAALRGQRAPRTRRLTNRNMHRHDSAMEALTDAIVRYAVDRVRLTPPPLDHPRTPDELRDDGRPDDHRRRHRRAGGAAPVR